VAKSRKTGIRLSIEQILFPEIEARGFRMADGAGWGRFSRVGANGTETLTIDFNKKPRWVGWFQMAFWGFIALFLASTLMAAFLLLVRGFKRLLTD